MNQAVFKCPKCAGEFQVPEQSAGQKINCPKCKFRMALPRQTVSSPPPPPVATPPAPPASSASPPPVKSSQSAGPPVPPPAPGAGTKAPIPPPPPGDSQNEPKVVSCPFCSGKFKLGNKYWGQSVGCPHCNESVATQKNGDVVLVVATKPGIAPAMESSQEMFAPGYQPKTESPETKKEAATEKEKSSANDQAKDSKRPSETKKDSEKTEQGNRKRTLEPNPPKVATPSKSTDDRMAGKDAKWVTGQVEKSLPKPPVPLGVKSQAKATEVAAEGDKADLPMKVELASDQAAKDAVAIKPVAETRRDEPSEQEKLEAAEMLKMLPPKFIDPSIAERKKNSVLIPNAHGGFVELNPDVTKVNYGGSQYEVTSNNAESAMIARLVYRLIVFLICAALLFAAFFLLWMF